ncbi:hypothetical protein NQ318_023026 [Aromia moschata]|uniref:GTPase Era, mitochondrial n=1 Tax=Aromia moschata TaxID=1265417 RepID=A0AAV8XWP7_9CUCU|nr:hypothetical protein NQ318_023026 [Aromia moschata]
MLLKIFKNTLVKSNAVVFQTRFCASTPTSLCKDAQTPLTPEYDFETRLLKVAVIGMPNAGKSTFINNLMDRKVCASSAKVHTTRGKAMAVFTEDSSQIVFIDTPGLVNDKEQKRYNLEKSFIKDSKSMLHQVDVIGVIHDVTNIWTRERLDIKIIKLLEMHKKKSSFLIFNKVDALKSKRKLLYLTRQLTENCIDGKPIPSTKPLKKLDPENKGWPYFQEIFMVSALKGDGLSKVKDYLISQAKPSKWMFPEEVWTDQSAETIIKNTVQATLLDFLQQEIPYNLKPAIEYFDVSETGAITTVVLVDCPSQRIANLVAGASDGRLRQMMASVQQDLQDTFRNHVKINIVLKPPLQK